MSANDAQKARIAALHARIKTHKLAVDSGKENYAGEPEVDEYVRRWEVLVAEANAMGENASAFLSGPSDAEISDLEARFNGIVHEWNDRVPVVVALRRQVDLNKDLQKKVDAEAGKKKRDAGEVVVPNLNPDLPKSAATTPDSPEVAASKERKKEKNGPALPMTEVKLGVVGAMIGGTFAGTIAVKGDAAKIAVATGSSILTIAAALVMFWPEEKKQ